MNYQIESSLGTLMGTSECLLGKEHFPGAGQARAQTSLLVFNATISVPSKQTMHSSELSKTVSCQLAVKLPTGISITSYFQTCFSPVLPSLGISNNDSPLKPLVAIEQALYSSHGPLKSCRLLLAEESL